MTFAVDVADGRANACGHSGTGMEIDLSLEPLTFSGTDHGPPMVGGDFLEEENFEFAVGSLVSSMESDGDDFGIIQDEKIARLEELGEVGKMVMSEGWLGEGWVAPR